MTATATSAQQLNDETQRAVPHITVVEGPQFRMGTLELVNLPERDAKEFRKRWKLANGDVYDATYTKEFVAKNIAKSQFGAKPFGIESRYDRARQVVNVRIIFQ
ncbi:MAG: hypothetical protein M3R55_14580 [Acidobacteriota bacterium]|nr:hypothetical protein [Acidobacteriota bacterium]